MTKFISPGMSPLVVDLDGTLLRSDLLLETGMDFLRRHPLGALRPLFWLLQGKPILKQELASRSQVDVTVLPYDQRVVALLRTEREKGRHVILATASHQSLAESVSEHLQLFDDVIGSDGSRNLKSHAKRDLLVERYGAQGFDYLGNSKDDIAIWSVARHAYLVNAPLAVERRARAQGNVIEVFDTLPVTAKDWLKACRLHQWAKNLLIFIPLLASHQITNPVLLWQCLLAFILFGLCASSVYVLNDLLDLSDDRHHPTKCNRPFAAGRLPISAGLLTFPLLLLVSASGALLLLPLKFAIVLFAYYILTLSYSLALKRFMAVDVIVLAMLYTSRLIAGTSAGELQLTFWILAFSMFIFLSLALVKRYAELRDARKRGRSEKTRGRGYYPDDLEMIASLGASSGYLSVLVLAMYIYGQAATGLYTRPQIIWLACPLLLFWITRLWMLTHRGQMHDDPVVFAVRDRLSLMVGVLFCLVFWMAV